MDKRYENFIATICNCATPTNVQTDEEFRYILFEVLGVDVFTVFSEKNLGDLIKEEALVNSFFVQLGVSELNVLDWQHDCFSFCPNAFGKLVKEYHDDERNCNVYFPSYYPNGDYYFFVDQDGKYALFGHPWLHEIVVYGQELIDLFEENKRALELGELFIQRVDAEDDYTRDGIMI